MAFRASGGGGAAGRRAVFVFDPAWLDLPSLTRRGFIFIPMTRGHLETVLDGTADTFDLMPMASNLILADVRGI